MEWLFDIILLPLRDWRVGIIIFILTLYYYLTSNFDYFQKMGIPHPKPYPIVGTAYLFFTESVRDQNRKALRQFGKVWGGFANRKPNISIADESILREVLVKQFASFPNHNVPMFKANKYTARLLTVLNDDEWRHVRRLLTPTFTAGKLKQMAASINKCSSVLAENLHQQIQSDPVLDVKTLCGGYTMDVIATTAFGIEVSSQKDPHNDFVRHTSNMIKSVNGFNLGLLLGMISPKLALIAAKLGIHIFHPDDINFFVGVVNQILEMRVKEEKEGTDFMGMMATAHKMKVEDDEAREIGPGSHFQENAAQDSSKALDKVDIVAAGLVFFLAGFDTVASGMSITLHHLAANVEWQEKVHEEIESVLQGKSSVTYDHLNQMPYLEMCIMESLRLDPPAALTDRECVADTTINGIHFKKGMKVFIQISAIHYDPDYYPDPEKFDPERFTPEAKAVRSPYVYLPFGQGPRDCIGKRLALMEMKIGIVYILRRFRLKLADGEKRKMTYANMGSLLSTWLKCEKRGV